MEDTCCWHLGCHYCGREQRHARRCLLFHCAAPPSSQRWSATTFRKEAAPSVRYPHKADRPLSPFHVSDQIIGDKPTNSGLDPPFLFGGKTRAALAVIDRFCWGLPPVKWLIAKELNATQCWFLKVGEKSKNFLGWPGLSVRWSAVSWRALADRMWTPYSGSEWGKYEFVQTAATLARVLKTANEYNKADSKWDLFPWHLLDGNETKAIAELNLTLNITFCSDCLTFIGSRCPAALVWQVNEVLMWLSGKGKKQKKTRPRRVAEEMRRQPAPLLLSDTSSKVRGVNGRLSAEQIKTCYPGFYRPSRAHGALIPAITRTALRRVWMRGPRYACVRACAHLPPKIMPIKPWVSKVSLYKCVFIYLSSFRKLGNWKPRGVYNQISTNIQAAHIQLLTRPEPTYTLRSSLAKHHVERCRATTVMLQSQTLARHSCPAVAQRPTCLYWAAFGLGVVEGVWIFL